MALCVLISCSEEVLDDASSTSLKPISITGNLRQENVTRANDYGFVSGDRMGIYIVDYDGGQSGSLAASGNRASNVLYTFNEEEYVWTAPLEIYWRDSRTPVDVYGYYPGTNYIADPSSYQFEVSWQQSTEPKEGELSNYETSDLLWGKAEHIEPTTTEIVIDYHHQLAGVYVTLQKGEGVTDTEWAKLDKIVQIDNTVRTCDFNLQTAEITVTGEADRSILMLPQSNDRYRAVVVPQTIEAGKQLISVTIDGQTYSHKLSEPMKYQGGKMHNFTLTVNKNSATGDYSVAFTDGGITDWVNDETSHSFKQNQYVIINCKEPGKLKESITEAGYDYKEMQNLKVTGTLTTEDFWFMRDEMSVLAHLNLNDVKVKNARIYYDYDKCVDVCADDAIPESAFCGNKTIRSLILPTGIKRISGDAFSEMQLMYSTLEIPDGVTYLSGGAFSGNEYNGVELILPNTIDSICSYAFYNCSYNCEINFTDNIKYIGPSAFACGNWDNPSRMHGVFHVPSKLSEINDKIFVFFGSDGSITGEIEIPQGIKRIGAHAFQGVAFKNRINLTLPQGVKEIGGAAFSGKRFASLKFNDDLEEIGQECFFCASAPFQIELPSQLRSVEVRGLFNMGLEGELVIPENCLSLGESAFALNDLTSITLPSRIEFIPNDAFGGSRYTSITIPKYVNYIGKSAFRCPYLQTVVCLAETPPAISDGDPFAGEEWEEGVYKDKCILEVPEKSVELYRNTAGWNTFKNITAHRELAYNIPNITCMEKGITREGILRTEGAWEVAECPDWVTVTPSSATSKKTLVTVTVKPNSGSTREGKIVFSLKGKNYTYNTDVRQITADVKEDQKITLQRATKGSRAIPIFIIGEGYNADDIASGQYLNDMKEQMEHIFSIEPMKTYRDYFTVSTAIACSPESGIDGVTKFDFMNESTNSDQMALEYAWNYGVGIKGNERNSTILVLLNTKNMGSTKTTIDDYTYRDLSISWVGKSEDVYPFNQQGFILREVVGTGFGKLGPEYTNHFTFMKSCGCPGCNMTACYNKNHAMGRWQNVSISGKMTDLPWYHLIFDEKYSSVVDVYEGALNHSRGTYRSENMSVMGNRYIPYFNTISREILVKRIMEASGGTFNFETFKANDKIEFPESEK